MGRSVSYPNDAVAVAYRDASFCIDSFDWDDFVENIREMAKEHFTSFVNADEWLDIEDHVILENTYAQVGVSEYGGVASVWLRSKSADYRYKHDAVTAKASDDWCETVAEEFRHLFCEYTKITTFSNGESLYRRL